MGRWPIGACALPLVLAATSARASVSIAVGWDALLHESNASAVVTPVETLSVWEDGRIYTYTRVRVDRALAGELTTGSEAWVRTMGGVVGKIGQAVEGEAVLAPGRSSLVFLHAGPAEQPTTYEVTARGQGQFPLVTDATRGAMVVRSTASGVIVVPRAATTLGNARLAADVIHGRAVEDVARDVAVAWGSAHAP
jgi:hypothetical protein